MLFASISKQMLKYHLKLGSESFLQVLQITSFHPIFHSSVLSVSKQTWNNYFPMYKPCRSSLDTKVWNNKNIGTGQVVRNRNIASRLKHTHTHTHIYIIYIYTHTRTRIHTHTPHTHTHTHHTHHPHTHTLPTHTHTHIYIYIYTHTNTRYKHIYIYTHTYTHTHTCIHICSSYALLYCNNIIKI